MPPKYLFDISTINLDALLFDQEKVRAANPQRGHMEHLNGILVLDAAQHLVVGFKDVRADEFWARGHMPGYPILPGVLMCEAAAQLCSYYSITHGHARGDFIGFGGLENVRFRGQVRPGDRLLLIGKATKLHRRQTIFNVQGFVGAKLVFNGDIIGVPLTREEEA